MSAPGTRRTEGRPFRHLLGASWTSNFGDGIRNAALPLLATELGSGASDVTLVAAAGTVPFAVFGLVAGTFADRRARRPLIVGAHLARAVVVAVVAILLWQDEMTLVFAAIAAFALGCGEALADSATPALIPELVTDADLEGANASLETAELVANDLVGPPTGGVLYSVSSALPFVADAISFVGAAAIMARLGHTEVDRGRNRTSTWRADIAEGVRSVWTNRVLRATGGIVVALQIGHVAALAPFVVYLTNRLDLDANTYGVFLAVGSLGGLAGARFATRIIRRFGSHRTLVGVLSMSIGSFLLVAIPTVATVAVGFATSFGAVVIGRIIVFSARQRSVPSHLLGRAQGAVRSLIWTSATIGAVIGGVLYDQVSPQAPYLFAAGVYAAVAAVVATSMGPILRAPTAGPTS